MTNQLTDLDAYTDEDLEQALAGVLVQAQAELLNDADVQEFWQLCEAIKRRALTPVAKPVSHYPLR
jgi:hypothetical protein